MDPITSNMMQERVDPEALKLFVSKVYQNLDLPKKNADICADVIISADLRGVDSHGINRFDMYVNELEGGAIDPRAQPEIKSERASAVVVDGKNAMGAVIGEFSMREAIKRAKEFGTCSVSALNGNHYGIAGYYAMMALKENMIGMSMTNACPLVVPTYGKKVGFGTNPIAFAAPAKKERAFVLDMATSGVPIGKVELMRLKGESIPLGWGVDESGKPTTDPAKVCIGGGLMPLGGPAETAGYKGYGLAIMVEILTAQLSGALFGTLLKSWKTDHSHKASLGHFCAAWDIEAFMPAEEFKERMDEMITLLKSAPKSDGESRIYVAGEKEFEEEERRTKNGLSILPKTKAALLSIGKRHGVDTGFLM